MQISVTLQVLDIEIAVREYLISRGMTPEFTEMHFYDEDGELPSGVTGLRVNISDFASTEVSGSDAVLKPSDVEIFDDEPVKDPDMADLDEQHRQGLITKARNMGIKGIRKDMTVETLETKIQEAEEEDSGVEPDETEVGDDPEEHQIDLEEAIAEKEMAEETDNASPDVSNTPDTPEEEETETGTSDEYSANAADETPSEPAKKNLFGNKPKSKSVDVTTETEIPRKAVKIFKFAKG